jgi:hypothetical protein
MKSLKTLVTALLISAVLSMVGCASAQVPSATEPATATESVTLADVDAKLDNAIAIATAANDQPGVACFTATKGWVDTLPIPQALPVLPDPTGLSGTFETARVKVIAVQAKARALKLALAAGAPPAVNVACAPLYVDAAALAAKVLALAGLSTVGLPALSAVNAALPFPLP